MILPAYNAEETLEMTYNEIPHDIVDEVILVDDKSQDGTFALARKLNIEALQHDRNKGYGANQKTCYAYALSKGADIIVMLHPDYQYTPKLVRAMVSLLSEGLYDVVLGSRILGKGALVGGMPLYKYIANRFLTLIENLLVGQKLSEYHTGLRAFSREVLEEIRLEDNSDDFVFDNEMLVNALPKDSALPRCPAQLSTSKKRPPSILGDQSLMGLDVCGWVSPILFIECISSSIKGLRSSNSPLKARASPQILKIAPFQLESMPLGASHMQTLRWT